MYGSQVSAVIPVFNGEKRISATLNSIINQDYENLEIILVNDASSDDTLGIAEEILENSKRKFKIINHEKNLGVSTARNNGFENASGEYIFFCDGDDLIRSSYVSELENKISKNNCDISFCGRTDRFEDGKPDEFFPVEFDSEKIFTGDELLQLRIVHEVIPHLCCMMFRKNFLFENNLRFHDGCIAFEDVEFQIKTLCHAKKISFVKDCLYIYIHGSEMGSVRFNDTDERKLTRYVHSSQAHERLAEYLSVHAPSERVKFLADNLLMPEAVIRKFTIEARKNDKAAYNDLCKNKKIREILKHSIKILFMKPEIFLKSLMVLYAPNLYYRMRSKK